MVILNTKSAKCDKFSKIFLGKKDFVRIMGDIDNMGNNKTFVDNKLVEIWSERVFLGRDPFLFYMV